MEYELVTARRHPHPLLFEREGNSNNGGVCCRCRLPLSYTPCFRCSESDCDYQIHESCLHLPPQINSSFHPQHRLSLNSFRTICDACDQWSDLVYRCDECSFNIDIKCAISDIKLRKTSNGEYVHICHHQHPLTLSIISQQQNGAGETNKVVYCVVCEFPIQSNSSTYFCSRCDDRGHFHKQCAELPIQVQVPEHPHPFHLQTPPTIKGTFCHGCQKEAFGFIYSCLKCKWLNLHIPCLQSLNHKHNFTGLGIKMKFRCGVCGEKSKDESFVFLCDICRISVHDECREFSMRLKIYEHKDHELTFFNYFYHLCEDDQCMICGKVVNKLYGGYSCSQCDYLTHFKCARERCMELSSMTDDRKENNIENFNSIHSHTLTVFDPKEISQVEYRVCDGCMKCLSNSSSSYGCAQCDFYIHEECAKLPTKIQSPVHQHFLALVSIPNFLFQCEACLQHFHGFAYRCKSCLSTFDTRCALIQTRILHPNHQHPLFLKEVPYMYNYDYAYHDCDACGEMITFQKLKFLCVKTNCKFNLDLRCATMPDIVRYRFDQHPLRLTSFEKERTGEFYCDICEEKREMGMWFYSCRKCSFEAHQSCVLGEFPFVKSAMHKSHKHPLNLVTVMKNQDNNIMTCGACNYKLCAHDFAFQCGSCKFNVHANGPCYKLQLSEGKLVFSNHNLFSRANQPYHHSIQKLSVMELGPFGSSSKGKIWKESVFSSIRAFVVYHDNTRIKCIQIQYPKNEELVWSLKHGKDEGTKSEVYFDYPDEYLVSIHGSYHWSPHFLSSLKFKTNRKSYGHFGEKGYPFSSKKDGVKIIGIFGSINNNTGYLDSIGFQGISTIDE